MAPPPRLSPRASYPDPVCSMIVSSLKPAASSPDLLDADLPGTVRLTVAEAVALGERSLQRVGYSGEDARIIVDQLVDNALCGYKFTGLPRLLAIASDE